MIASKLRTLTLWLLLWFLSYLEKKLSQWFGPKATFSSLLALEPLTRLQSKPGHFPPDPTYGVVFFLPLLSPAKIFHSFRFQCAKGYNWLAKLFSRRTGVMSDLQSLVLLARENFTFQLLCNTYWQEWFCVVCTIHAK